LAKGDIEIGKALPFPIYDRQGHLLLAANQAVTTVKQLDELAAKGLYHNPRWASNFTIQNKATMGSVAPTAPTTFKAPTRAEVDDPTETGNALKMNLPGQAEAFPVRLVGALGKDAFVISHPVRDDQFVFVKEGDTWEFRSFYGLSVYRFKSQVQKVLLGPHALVVMSWPQHSHLEAKPVRATRRVNCELPSTAHVLDDPSRVYNAVIRNLSTGGAEYEVLAKVDWPVGTQLSVACQVVLAHRKYLLELPAKVVTTQPHEGQHSRFGLAFVALDDRDFVVLHAFVSELLMHRLEPPLYVLR
jgi:hypothetical protein